MQKKTSAPANHVPTPPFLEKPPQDGMGILHSFDRLRRQGSRRDLYCRERFEESLRQAKVLAKDFKPFATGRTAAVCQPAAPRAHSLGRPLVSLASRARSKQEQAQQLALRDPIQEGVGAVVSCVAPCRTAKMRGHYPTTRLEPHLEFGKGLPLYF